MPPQRHQTTYVDAMAATGSVLSATSMRRCITAALALFAFVIATDEILSVESAVATESSGVPGMTNPLRTADGATRAAALSSAWTTYLRSCQPCHGVIGAGDGPYATTFPKGAADLRRPSREIGADATRFARIRDGAAALPERAWESNMPAFGDELDTAAIWGLVALLDDLGKSGSGLDSGASGADMYAARCAACHGRNGAGDGPVASELLPPPTNFVHAAYRFRSTAFGEAPLDSDIIGSTARGCGSTAMGRFLSLGTDRLEELARYLMAFSPKRFADAPITITTSSVPALSIDQLTVRGRAVYEEAKCAECHGVSGRGDGPSASSLKDDEGHRSLATNLTQRWKYKVGSSPTDIYRTLTSGLNGTSMKSYADLSDEDRWAVAHYLSRLGRVRPRAATSIQAVTVTDELPLDPSHTLWQAALRTEIPMSPQLEVAPHWGAPAIDAVAVAAAVNKDELGILLVWDDPTRNVRTEEERASSVAVALARHGAWKLTDAIAVELPQEIDPGGTLPPSLLGDERHPVRRWYWTGERQDRGESEALVQLIAGPRAVPTAGQEERPIRTAAAYAEGQWRVVMIAKRPSELTSMPVAFQAWDGGAGESGTWLSTSAWVKLSLQ